MRLDQLRPRPESRDGVYLNEPLVLHFSHAVDVASVTTASLVVQPVGGGPPAAGRIEVVGDRVRFQPHLGVARDLSDGGLLPGTAYEVVVRGFPAPDGLRSVDGLPLERSARVGFTTAALGGPPRQMFDDRTPGRGERLVLTTTRLASADSLLFDCAEPLDPSSLTDGEFSLRPLLGGNGGEVPLDPHLLENSHERGARLELRPRRRLAPGRYLLEAPPEVSVRDLGGNPVWVPGFPGEQVVEVEEGGEVRSRDVESFLEDARLSTIPVPGVDGAATWGDGGRVTIRYPAAAGDGSAGPVVLRGAEGRRDLHATRLEVPQGAEVELGSAPGLVVLRSQGRLSIAGRVTRSSGPGNAMNPERGATLTQFLARARELAELGGEPNWTVLVAGGDLFVPGELVVEGPLLLVAGGRIVVTGRVRAQEGQLWLLGRGGGSGLQAARGEAELVIDPPYLNPLAAPLTFGALSAPMPASGGVLRWIGAEVVGDARDGRLEVLFVPADADLSAPRERWGAVRSPRELLSAPALRLLILLSVEPPDPRSRRPPPWNPPLVDEVRLEWEPGRR